MKGEIMAFENENMLYRKKDLTLLNVYDMAQILGIGKSKAYKLVKEGKIRAFRIDKKWKVPREAVDEYIMLNSKWL